jgi:phenylacetate-CoA ligase
MVEGKFYQPKIEKLSKKELEKLQLKRLKWTVKHAFTNNKVYHDKLVSVNMKPADFKTLKDIEKIPFLTKDDLRNWYPFGLSSVDLKHVVELHASSGTTGKPVVGLYTRHDLDVWSECMARNLYTNTLRKEDIYQNAYGYGLFTGAHGFERGAQRVGALMVPISSGNTQRQIRLMKDFGATALGSTPSYAIYMAEVARQMDMDPTKDFKLRIATVGAESWSEVMRKKLNEAWNLEAFDHYGLTEMIGPGISTECNKHDGLHINADHFYPEIIDPATGKTLGPGEKGELVLTSLTKEAFPVLRFRTKDLTMLIDEKCSCGRCMPRHARLMGRSDDMMKVKGVIVFPKQIEEAVMAVNGASENYLIIKNKTNLGYALKVRVEPSTDFHGDRAVLSKAITSEIYAILNLDVPVEVVDIGALPRSEGKAKRVIEE